MIRPEIDHHLTQLPLRQRSAHDGELLQLATQLANLSHRAGHSVGRDGVTRPTKLALHPLALALRVAVALREVPTVIVEDLERVFASLERLVIDVIRIELPFDPAHDAVARHAIHLAGARPVGQTIQGMQSGVARRHRRSRWGRGRGRHLRGERRRQGQRGGDRKRNSHPPILTVVSMRS